MKCNFICKHFASNPINTYVCCYWASNACICCSTIFCCWLCACDCCEKTCRTLLTCLCCPIQISLNFLLLLSLVPVLELSHSSFLKILALRRLYLFSCRPYFSVIWRVSLKLFMAISRPSRALFLSSSAILFVYHVLLIIAIATEIQNILQQNIILWWLFSTFAR